MNDNFVFATSDQAKAGAGADNAGNHARRTVVLFEASDGILRAPEVHRKTTDPTGPRDVNLSKIPQGVSVRFTPAAADDTNATIRVGEDTVSQPHFSQFGASSKAS